jgi:hypothetical protein
MKVVAREVIRRRRRTYLEYNFSLKRVLLAPHLEGLTLSIRC